MNYSQTVHPGDVKTILACLEDDACRAILTEAGGAARTAKELSERCSLPTSTVYRKLEELTDAGLLHEGTRIRRSGKHSSEYRLAVEAVTVSLGDDVSTDLEVTDEFSTARRTPPRRVVGD